MSMSSTGKFSRRMPRIAITDGAIQPWRMHDVLEPISADPIIAAEASTPFHSGAMSVGTWEPLWLQDGQGRSLYAGLHRPVVNAASLGVLLVPPLLIEQPRSRRFVTEVASGLAALGLPCLRFDFFGTGDSAGTGDQADFASMCIDIELAAGALRARAGVERVAVLAWRGAVLALWPWILGVGNPEVVVLWEPIVDGAEWLDELEREDVAERRSRKRYPLRQVFEGDASDGQLMGLEVSDRLRQDLAGARLAGGEEGQRFPVWAVQRQNAPPLPIALERSFALPADTPSFGGGIRMDTRLCVSRSLGRVVIELGQALAAVA
jgi:hypothetical protein